jgi:hypothetical protein
MDPYDEEGQPQKFCNPLRSPDCWRITGKATAPHPITGARTMLTLIKGDKA